MSCGVQAFAGCLGTVTAMMNAARKENPCILSARSGVYVCKVLYGLRVPHVSDDE